MPSAAKKELFTRSLLRYDRDHRQVLLNNLSALNDPVKAITLLFDGMIDQSLQDDEKKAV